MLIPFNFYLRVTIDNFGRLNVENFIDGWSDVNYVVELVSYLFVCLMRLGQLITQGIASSTEIGT